MRERGGHGGGGADLRWMGRARTKRSRRTTVLFCVLLNGVTVSPCRRVALADIKVSVRPGLN